MFLWLTFSIVGWLVGVNLELPFPLSSFAPSWAVYISELPSLYLIPWIVLHHVSLQEFASRHSVFQPQTQSHSEDSQVEKQGQVNYASQHLHEPQGASSLLLSQAFQLQEFGDSEFQSQKESASSSE